MTLSLPMFGNSPDPFAGLLDDDRSRWYQLEAKSSVEEGFSECDSQLVVMATGLGKTFVASSIIRDWQGDCLWLVHGNELVQQAIAELEAMTGEYVDIEKAAMTASHKSRIVVASADSLCQDTRLQRMGKDRFGLIVFDEAHMAMAPSYRKILEFFSAKRLGLTATPDRADEKSLGLLFDRVAYCMDIWDGIGTGYLVPVEGQRVFLKEINLEEVTSTKSDLVQTQLDEVMVKAVEGIVHKTVELHPERRGIAFCPGVRSAEYMMHKFNQLRPNSAAFVDGSTDPFERKRIIDDFRKGRIQYLCNCRVFTTGFDAPVADMIIQATPTTSRAFYAQTVGRGTRVLPGTVDTLMGKELAEARRAAIKASAKPNCLILDFVGNSGKHDLMSLEDVLGGDFTEEEVKLAKKRKGGRGDGPRTDPREALLKARRELQMRAATTKAKHVDAEVHPFDPFKVLGVTVKDSDRYTDRFGITPATDGQIALLRLKGVPDKELATLSKRAASKLVDQLTERQNRGLATYKQLRQLQRFGINSTDITFERAGAAITYISSKGWGSKGPIDPVELNAIINHRRAMGED